MYVISADQKSSRSTGDLVDEWRDALNHEFGATLTLPADRNAGDEIQVLTQDPDTVLEIALRLVRSGRWSVGVGIGAVRTPLPRETREASGPAFNAARDAVTEAKKRPTRFAVRTEVTATDKPWPPATDVQSVIDMLLEIRRKRSTQGWELYDILAQVPTQAEAASILNITPAAVSDRASAAGIRIERDARPSLVRLLSTLERAVMTTATDGSGR